MVSSKDTGLNFLYQLINVFFFFLLDLGLCFTHSIKTHVIEFLGKVCAFIVIGKSS